MTMKSKYIGITFPIMQSTESPDGLIRSLSKYDKDMLKIIIGELEQEAQDVNVPGMYEFEINWLKSFFGL